MIMAVAIGVGTGTDRKELQVGRLIFWALGISVLFFGAKGLDKQR